MSCTGVIELPCAKLDVARARRTGFGETVFGAGKTPEQLASIVRAFRRARQRVLVTRCSAEQAEALAAARIPASWDPVSRVLTVGSPRTGAPLGRVAVLTGGTADIPVAEEAAQTLAFHGARAERFYDVGVAGLQRLLGKIGAIRACDAVIAVAGMEGALGSVVAGLVASPVVAVPTSVGYGTGLSGLAPLLAMLNSCAEGLSVVNIDNGFGAAMCALRFLNRKPRARTASRGGRRHV